MPRLSFSDDDPLTAAMAPPAGETPEEALLRQHREAEAKRVSDAIDDELREERAALKKRKKPLKILLLGQAESGKSTTLKNFQMMCAPTAWAAERASWRAVVQLNLIRSVNTILAVLTADLTEAPRLPTPPASSPLPSPVYAGRPPLPLALTDRHRMLRLRLAPLRRVEADLRRHLGLAAEPNAAADGVDTGAVPPNGHRPLARMGSSTALRAGPEAGVRSWMGALGARPGGLAANSRLHPDGDIGVRQNRTELEEATEVLAGCRADIKELWDDSVVRELLTRHGMRIEDSAGFFLNDVDRIATRSYEPSDDDVVRARLRTTGVQEHRLNFEGTAKARLQWNIYDVGGCRTMRNAWIPYFDDVNAIIFLAPISCFDERLAEDPRVNRLEDTFLLWADICTSKFLAKSTLVVFLNKVDLLDRKLRAGVALAHYLTSYGERPNKTIDVIKYLHAKMREMHRQYSPEPRPFYGYPTSVIDTKATQQTLDSIRDGVLMNHLRGAEMIE